jgi:hypothetical protein
MNPTQIGYIISFDTTELDCDKQQEATSRGTTVISHAQNRTLEKTVVLIAVLLRDYLIPWIIYYLIIYYLVTP